MALLRTDMPKDAPLRSGLAAAVAELERARASALELQAALSPALQAGGVVMEAVQALDHLSQHLDGLGEYLAVIARDCPADWRLDLHGAARDLRLHSQKLRLTPGAERRAPVAEAAAGALELW